MYNHVHIRNVSKCIFCQIRRLNLNYELNFNYFYFVRQSYKNMKEMIFFLIFLELKTTHAKEINEKCDVCAVKRYPTYNLLSCNLILASYCQLHHL